MKKLLVVLLLVLAVSTGYSQTQFRVDYSEVAIKDKDEKVTRRAVENTIFFNYGNKPVIKMYLNDGSVRTFIQITDRENGVTEGGMVFSYAKYEEQSSNLTILLQLFSDRQYGARLVFKDGQTIQFIP